MIAERFPAVRGVEAISFSIAPRRGAVSIIEMVVLASCIIAVIAALALSNRYVVDIMIRTFLWAGLALAWNIAGGYAGLISFGHAAFFGIGAYTSTILLLNFGVSPWIGMWPERCSPHARGRYWPAVCAVCAARFSSFLPWQPAK